MDFRVQLLQFVLYGSFHHFRYHAFGAAVDYEPLLNFEILWKIHVKTGKPLSELKLTEHRTFQELRSTDNGHLVQLPNSTNNCAVNSSIWSLRHALELVATNPAGLNSLVIPGIRSRDTGFLCPGAPY